MNNSVVLLICLLIMLGTNIPDIVEKGVVQWMKGVWASWGPLEPGPMETCIQKTCQVFPTHVKVRAIVSVPVPMLWSCHHPVINWHPSCIISLVGQLWIYLYVYFWSQSMQDLISVTRDQTHAPCSGSMESYPLDHQRSPKAVTFWAMPPSSALRMSSDLPNESEILLPYYRNGCGLLRFKSIQYTSISGSGDHFYHGLIVTFRSTRCEGKCVEKFGV